MRLLAAAVTADPITEKYAVGLLQKMIAIPSPSYHEHELATFLVTEMRELGFTSWLDDAGNVIGEYVHGDGGGPTVMLLSHIDTVPGEVSQRVEAGRVYGRGSVDAKGPFAAMVCAARRATGFNGKVIVVGAVEEETALSRGAMRIRATLPQPDALIIGEPSGWSTVVLGYKGKLDLSYEVECEPTHPTNPAPKATELAGRCWSALLDLLGPEASHRSFYQPGANLISISGDPTKARAEFSIRTPPGFDAGDFVGRLRMHCPHGRITVINSVDAYRVGRTDPVVQALNAGIRAHGIRPTAKLKTATSDLNILTGKWHVPVATYGPGDSDLDHSANESIDITEYMRGISVLTAAVEHLTDLPAGAEPAVPAELTPLRPAEPMPADPAELTEKAERIRRRIVQMCAHSGGGHLGGSMSLSDILAALYSRVLRIDPDDPDADDRDVLILSKGHGAIGLYATLGEFGFFPPDRLADYGRPGTPFMAHPNAHLPGVEMPSGALGHGLSLAIGFALAARLDKRDRRCVVIMGDGEMQEGSVWEGAMAGSAMGLDQITAVIDRNCLQITGGTEETIALEPLADRWRSFGWTVREVDGHDIGALLRAFGTPPEQGRPTVVIAQTVKGRGLPYLENNVRSHFVKFGERQLRRAMSALQRTAEDRQK